MFCCFRSSLWQSRRRPQEATGEGPRRDESEKKPDEQNIEPYRPVEHYSIIKEVEALRLQDQPKRERFFSRSSSKLKSSTRTRFRNFFTRGKETRCASRVLEDDRQDGSSDSNCSLPSYQTFDSADFPPQTYVNCWDLEYKPNPVIFAHLQPKSYEDFYEAGLIDRSETDEVSEAPRPDAESPERSAEGESEKAQASPTGVFVCETCGAIFTTRGQRNTHIGRKHVRRFVCSISRCVASFHLNADLQRHRRTVHRDEIDTEDNRKEQWKCTNLYCKTPDLVFTRRDNFQRHLLRCRRSQS